MLSLQVLLYINRAVDIHNRLVCDHDYLNKMTRLVRLLMVIISLLIFIQPLCLRASRFFERK